MNYKYNAIPCHKYPKEAMIQKAPENYHISMGRSGSQSYEKLETLKAKNIEFE